MNYKHIIFLVIILISFSSAIKISPTQQSLSLNPYETNCTNIWILPKDNYIVSSRWSMDGRGDLEKYTLTSEKIRLNISHSKDDEKYEFCFTPGMAGNFSGIIYFYSEKTMVEIGSWVEIHVAGQTIMERVSLITGNAIRNQNSLNVGLGVIFILLIIVLILVIRNIVRNSAFKHKHSQIDYSA